VSPNTPRHYGEDNEGVAQPEHARVASDEPAGDSYSERLRPEAPPDLDAGAPELRSQDFRRMNRRAVMFLAAIVLLLIILAGFLYHAATGPRALPKRQAETLVVPQLPQSAMEAPSVQPAAQTPVKPIASMPQVPPVPVIRTQARQAREGPDLVARREMSDDTNEPEATPVPGVRAPANSALGGFTSQSTSAQPLLHPDTLLLRGTFIRCVLETRIVSDIPGFTSCSVTGSVYSFDGRRLLLPKGSKVFGSYDAGPVGERIAVVWDRIVTPNGIDVNMSSPGVDNLGGSGLPGYLDSHWPSRISSAVLISLMSDAFLYEGEKHGPQANSIGAGGVIVQSPYQSNTAQTLQNLANQAVRQSANRAPTLTINQGSVITIYVAKDVDFSNVASKL
jgi:type IV secretion system protein VirB10